MICEHLLAILLEKSELKPEEGYSADIVRTYIPGDICPHNVRTISHEGDVVRTYISRDICLHNVRTISFFGFQLWQRNGSRVVGAIMKQCPPINSVSHYCIYYTSLCVLYQ